MYVAVKGGERAIDAAHDWLGRAHRGPEGQPALDTAQIRDQMGLAVARVMAEGSLYDPDLAALCAGRAVPVCVMHSKGDPKVMQNDPRYADVLLEVYDFLAERVAALSAAGIPRARIVVDPGIGFGKTQSHNLALLQGLSLFHGLGCAILLGASRKRFIGTIGGAEPAEARAPGSIAVGLAGLAQGVQILRVHDVAETAQALRLWRAVRG